MAAPNDLNDLIAVDRGKVLSCSACGRHFVVWNAANLTFKTAMAVFTAWFGTFTLGVGLFSLSVLFRIPAMLDFEGREPGEATAAYVVAAFVGLLCAYLSYSAYIPDVVRQWILRMRLRGRLGKHF
jgi:hypothetical protein